MKEQSPRERSNNDSHLSTTSRTLVIIDPHFPFYDRWAFLEDEAEFLATHPQTQYQKIEFIATPILRGGSSVRKQAKFGGSRSTKLGVEYKPIRSWTYATLRLFSVEARREWRRSRDLQNPPTFFFAYKRMFQYFLVAARLDLYLRDKLKESATSITLYSYWLSLGAYGIANLKKQHPGITTVARCHGSEVNDSEVYVPFRDIVDRYLDKIIFVAQNRENEYDRIMRDLAINNNQRAGRAISRLGLVIPQNFGPTPDGPTLHVLTVSSVEANKRLDLIVDGLSAAKLPIVWTHVGDGPLRSHIETLAQEKLGISSNVSVKFLGRLQRESVLKLLSSSAYDVFVNMSDSEGVPVSMMEAMAFGIPSIGRAVGGIPELIEHGKAGILLPKDGDGKDLALALRLFQPNRNQARTLRKKLGTNARAKVQQEYDLEKNLLSFYNLIQAVEEVQAHETSFTGEEPLLKLGTDQ